MSTEHVAFVEASGTGAGERCAAYAAEQGYRVSILSARPEPPGARHADEVVVCDTADDEAVVAAARALHSRTRVDGVTTTHDLHVPQACAVAEALGLPGTSRDAAAGVRNKHLMRRRLADTRPDLNPPFALVRTVDEALAAAGSWGYPVVAKPPDANDSWHVRRLDGPDALTRYMETAATWGDDHPNGARAAPGVLLEGFLDGPEFTVELVVRPGHRPEPIGAGAKEWEAGDGTYFPERTVYFPAPDPVVAEQLCADLADALVALEITCGVIHAECRLVGGATKVVEVNPRLAGDMFGSHALELATGASPVRHVVELALGRDLPWEPTRSAGAAITGVPAPADGFTFHRIANLAEVRAMPGVEAVTVAAPDRPLSFPPRSNLDYVARVVASGATSSEALHRAHAAAAHAEVV